MELKLTNRQQRDIFEMLGKRRLPDFFSTLYASFDATMDFLQAFIKFRQEHMDDPWSLREVLPLVRSMGLAMSSEQVSGFVARGFERWLEGTADLTLIILPFSSTSGDTRQAVAKWEQVVLASLSEGMLAGNLPDAGVLIVLLISSAGESRTWYLFSLAVAQGDKDARTSFRHLIGFFALVRVRPVFLERDNAKCQWILQEDIRPTELWNKLLAPGRVADDLEIEPIYLPVPEEAVYGCNRLYRQIAREHNADVDSFIKLVAWFAAYEDYFQELAGEFWYDITTNPKYGLKAEGHDVVKIQITALRKHGYRYVQLFPEPGFPQARARVWLELKTLEKRFYVEQQLKPGPLFGAYPGDSQDSFASTCDKLQQFIAIHSMWKIVMGKIFRARPKRTSSGERQRTELERAFLLRPHYRWLVPGNKASDLAKTRSVAEFAHEPPAGKTFVKSDVDPASIRIVPPTEENAVVTYTEADLDYAESV